MVVGGEVQSPLTPERKEAFLKELRRTGIFASACRAASPNSHARGCQTTFRKARKEDPEFAEAWDEALEEARGKIEEEIHRRAIDGWDDPVFQGGDLVGNVRKYSDTLLLAKARAKLPEYQDRKQVEHAGLFAVVGLEKLATLSREARDAIRKVVEIEAARAQISESVPEPVESVSDAEFSVLPEPTSSESASD